MYFGKRVKCDGQNAVIIDHVRASMGHSGTFKLAFEYGAIRWVSYSQVEFAPVAFVGNIMVEPDSYKVWDDILGKGFRKQNNVL